MYKILLKDHVERKREAEQEHDSLKDKEFTFFTEVEFFNAMEKQNKSSMQLDEEEKTLDHIKKNLCDLSVNINYYQQLVSRI